MADTDMDSDPAVGTPSSPNGGSSGGTGDSKSSIDAAKLQSTIEALTKKLDEVDARSKALQGDKDRAVTKTKSEVDELKRKIAEIEKLKKSGLDEDEALTELSFREEVRSLKDQLKSISPAQPEPAGNGKGSEVDVAKVLKEYSLDGNDPEVVAQILGKKFNSELEAENAALKLAYRRATPNPPSPAASSAFTGTPARPSNEADLISRLRTLQSNPAKNWAEIQKLEKELGW